MSLTDRKSWREENRARARRLVAICSLVALALAALFFHSDIKGFLSSHSWWESTVAGLPELALAVLAYFELRYSGEANALRRRIGVLAYFESRRSGEVNELRRRVADLEEEKAWHLSQIATKTQRPAIQADFNAGTKWHGTKGQLGDIKTWEENLAPSPALDFDKGPIAYQAGFNKQGSSETRSLRVFAAKDGANLFLLETGSGETTIGDNVGISKLVASLDADYRSQGFDRNSSSTYGTQHPLFIR